MGLLLGPFLARGDGANLLLHLRLFHVYPLLVGNGLEQIGDLQVPFGLLPAALGLILGPSLGFLTGNARSNLLHHASADPVLGGASHEARRHLERHGVQDLAQQNVFRHLAFSCLNVFLQAFTDHCTDVLGVFQPYFLRQFVGDFRYLDPVHVENLQAQRHFFAGILRQPEPLGLRTLGPGRRHLQFLAGLHAEETADDSFHHERADSLVRRAERGLADPVLRPFKAYCKLDLHLIFPVYPTALHGSADLEPFGEAIQLSLHHLLAGGQGGRLYLDALVARLLEMEIGQDFALELELGGFAGRPRVALYVR